MGLTSEPVHHLVLGDGRRFYCRVLKKSRNSDTWYGAVGFANREAKYQAITQDLPWEVTPANEVPDNMKPAGSHAIVFRD